MCDAISLGVASFAMGAISSIAGYQSQSQAAAASEQAYQQQRDLNQQAANRAYQQQQLKFKGEFDQATQKAEQLLTQRLQAQGNIMASGRTGQSVGALLTDAQRTEGRDLGTLGLNLAYAQQDYGFGMENIFQQQQVGNVSAASQRLAAPSVGGLVLGIGEAALSGASTYMSLKDPKGFTGQAKPTPIPKAQLPGGRAGTVINWS
jgi:hypothetical protein